MEETSKVSSYKFKYSISLLSGMIFWIYILIKILFFDIEESILKFYGFEDHWLLNWKVLIYLTLIGIIWKYLGNYRFFLNLIVILFFPLILIFWHFPKYFLYQIPKRLLNKNKWLLFYVYVNSLINTLYSFQHNLIKIPLLILAIVIIINSNNKSLTLFSIFILLGVLAIHLYNRFLLAFSPIRLFRLNLQLLNKHNSNDQNTKIKSIESYLELKDDLTSDIKILDEKKMQAVDQILSTHGILRFLGYRLREFKSPRVYMAFTSIAVIYSIILCIFLISLINYAVFKYDYTQFNVNTKNEMFHFLYYSFNSFFFNSIQDIQPIGILAKTLNMMAPFIGLTLTLFVLTVYFSAKSEEYRNDIENVILFSDQKIKDLEIDLKEAFSLSVIEGFELLKESKISFSKFINQLNKVDK